jgi:hypothetical protein
LWGLIDGGRITVAGAAAATKTTIKTVEEWLAGNGPRHPDAVRGEITRSMAPAVEAGAIAFAEEGKPYGGRPLRRDPNRASTLPPREIKVATLATELIAAIVTKSSSSDLARLRDALCGELDKVIHDRQPKKIGR